MAKHCMVWRSSGVATPGNAAQGHCAVMRRRSAVRNGIAMAKRSSAQQWQSNRKLNNKQ
nr:MAG TPA: hypothetical protein [Caudoviricetes sp.]